MKKYIVLSVNMNPDYQYPLPIVAWAWKKLGWTPIVVSVRNYSGRPPIECLNADLEQCQIDFAFMGSVNGIEFLPIQEITGYRSGTIAQISRLYAACKYEGLIMTADADMIPLNGYWHPNINERTVYGYDLTGYKEYPICYISMPHYHWKEVMNITSTDIDYHIKRDLDSIPEAKSDDFYKYWSVDQQLITKRLAPYNPVQIKRGQYPNGLAIGRVDRAAWSLELDTFIDCHLFHQIYHKGREQYFEKMMELLTTFWPEEDFTWVREYTKEFRIKTGHG